MPPRPGGPVLLIGGSDALAAALESALVQDGWSVVRPTPGEPGAPGLASDAELEPFWTAPTPPAALVVAVDLRPGVVEATDAVARWIERLDPHGSAVLVHTFVPEQTLLERLARSALATLTEELARRAAPARRVNAVYGGPIPRDPTSLPRRRAPTLADLAATATFLAGPASAFATGIVISVDGGASLLWPLATV